MPFAQSTVISAAECISKPLQVVHKLLNALPANQATRESDWGVPAFFEQKLDGASVPILNSYYSRDGSQFLAGGPPHESLVRFRCMIQDTLNTEYYVGMVKCPKEEETVLRSGKYTEIFNLSEEEQKFVNVCNQEQISSRMVLNCVTIPGESDWLRQEAGIEALPEREMKRDGVPSSSSVGNSASSTSNSRKRGVEEEDDEDMDEQKTDTKRRVQDNTPVTDEPGSAMSIFPRMQCLVKVYTEDESLLKVGQTYEFLGVFCIPPELAEFEDDMDDNELINQPASQVLRLHAISYRPISANNCLVPEVSDSQKFSLVVNATRNKLDDVRSSLLQYLQSVCGGDSECAVLLLCHLVSRVHIRQLGKAVGKLSLNISLPATGANCDNTSFPAVIASLYQLLLPRVQTFELNQQTLCAAALYPVKDYNHNCLKPSALQMGQGTALLLDETRITAMNLDNTGCRNIRALAKISLEQKLEYDFFYHPMDFDVDYPLLVLSKGSSIIPADARYDLRAVLPTTLPTPPSAALVEQWRRYIAVSRHGTFNISDTAGNMITESFVALRQAQPKTNENQLHLRLSLARALCGTYLTDDLSPAIWDEVLKLGLRLITNEAASAGATTLAASSGILD